MNIIYKVFCLIQLLIVATMSHGANLKLSLHALDGCSVDGDDKPSHLVVRAGNFGKMKLDAIDCITGSDILYQSAVAALVIENDSDDILYVDELHESSWRAVLADVYESRDISHGYDLASDTRRIATYGRRLLPHQRVCILIRRFTSMTDYSFRVVYRGEFYAESNVVRIGKFENREVSLSNMEKCKIAKAEAFNSTDTDDIRLRLVLLDNNIFDRERMAVLVQDDRGRFRFKDSPLLYSRAEVLLLIENASKESKVLRGLGDKSWFVEVIDGSRKLLRKKGVVCAKRCMDYLHLAPGEIIVVPISTDMNTFDSLTFATDGRMLAGSLIVVGYDYKSNHISASIRLDYDRPYIKK